MNFSPPSRFPVCETSLYRLTGFNHLKFNLTLFLTIFFSFVSSFQAIAFRHELDGTMMPYDFSCSDTMPPWSSDYQPVFVNYIARHGARFLSSEKKVSAIRQELLKADMENRLTPSGRKFLQLTETVIAKTSCNWGALDSLGIIEEQRLGKELATLCPALFKTGNVKAIASYVPRVVMSMYEVCHSLCRHSPDLATDASEGKEYNPLLRFFTVNPLYVDFIGNGDWKLQYDDYYSLTVPCRPASLMLKGEQDKNKLQKLTMDAYGILQSLRATGITGNPGEWFSEEEYEACWKVSNLKHYLQRSDNPFSDLASKSALPLLYNIVTAADNAFSGNTTCEMRAYLRFGHAETIIPLFALMKLPGCYSPSCRIREVYAQWKDWEVSPLGANLIMVCLKNKEGDDFVALRLNGKWIEIDGRKIIPWPALRAFWTGA